MAHDQSRASILVVDDEPIILKSIEAMLQADGYEVGLARDAEEALDKLVGQPFDLVLTDVAMPGMSGIDLLKEVRAKTPDTVVVVITGYGNIEDAVTCTKLGAYDYLTKPLNDVDVKLAIERSLEQHRLQIENENLRRSLDDAFNFDNIISRDKKMWKVFDVVRAVAPTEASVLILGENGTGKSLLARAIHYNSPRRNKMLVEISCGALASNLLESELFGHARGSFTGAVSAKAGKFEVASGGTVFLDEIDTLSIALQVKLLRVLQDRQFERVGSNDTLTADVRIIAAANRDLEHLIEQDEFRRDLYYRLHVVSIELPQLKERLGDLSLLADHFIEKYAKLHHKPVVGVSKEALDSMAAYPWPGNIRELENAVERGVILCKGEYITLNDLPPSLSHDNLGQQKVGPIVSLRDEMNRYEKQIIEEALGRNGFNRNKTCRMLKINRTTLYNKMRRYSISGQSLRE